MMMRDRIVHVLGSLRVKGDGPRAVIDNVDQVVHQLLAIMQPDAELKFCNQCVRYGQTSTLVVRERRAASNNQTEEFYDQNGKHHTHQNNRYRVIYECSNGHQFSEMVHKACWCGQG